MQKVEIRVQGLLDPSWSEWLENLAILNEDEGQTLLTGQIVDQAILYGVLKKLRDLGLSLLLVKVTKIDLNQSKNITTEIDEENEV